MEWVDFLYPKGGETMASIRSQMVLNDGMSSVLRKITSALDTTLNAFEQVQRASGRAVDAASIAQARSQLVGANAELQEMTEGYRRAAEQEESLNQGLHTGNVAAGKMLGTVKSIAATIGAVAGLDKLTDLSDQMTSTRARLSLMVDDGDSVTDLESKIMASAQRSRAYYLDTASAIASMGVNAGSAFSGDDELIAFMEQVNKQFVIGGASAQGQSAAMLQLTQAMAAGALRGEELNSILENAPGIARAIESYMGVAEGSIKKYAEEGLITSEVVKNALFSVADETNAKFKSMPLTWAQVWTNMQNKALAILGPILNKLNQIAGSDDFNTFAKGAITALGALATVAGGLLDIVVDIGSFMVDNWSWISPIVWGLVAAFVAYNAVALVTSAINAAVAASEAQKAAGEMMSTGATFAATAAQHGLNAALLACPITWIVGAIIVLIALFYAAVAAVNHFAGTSVSATGIVCGVFMIALAFVGNLFITLFNTIADGFKFVWNVIALFINFLANVFTDPVGSIARLFFDLVDLILSLLGTVASAIDTVFGTSLGSAVQGWRDSLSGLVDDKFGSGVEIMATAGVEDWHLDRFEYGAAYDVGYTFGQGIDDTVGGLLNADLGSDTDSFTLDQILADTASIADSTGGMADALEVSSEQLEYLRDIAEREAVNRFTTAEVKIDMTGMTNRIDGNADLDGVLTTLTDGFAEALATAAEGVHV